MPSGISERLIQRALGPIDFSYAYQKVENTAKQLAAEDRARKQSALKDYYTDLASMNKDKVGVRSVDVPEVSGLYNEWSTIEKQLASNPNLISRNPELYGQLKNKSEETYSKLMTTIRGSKELGKQEQDDFKQMANPEKMDYYRDGAPAEYRKSVIERPWSEVIKNGTNDLTKYYETKIDGSKFYGDLGQRIESQATQKHRVPDMSFKGAPGEMRYLEFDKMPMIGEAQVIVADNLNAKLGKKANKFAVQQLEDAMATGDYQKVKAQYEDFYNDNNPNGWKKYFDKKPTYIPLFQDGKPQKELFINYVTAKEFTSKLPEGRLGKGEFGSESAKARYSSRLSLSNSIALKKIKGPEEEQPKLSLTPAFRVIASGGETGKQQAILTSNEFNQIGFGEKLFPFTPFEGLSQATPAYKTGMEVMKSLYGKKDPELVSLSKSEEKISYSDKLEKMNILAEKINEQNKKNGFWDSDVTGRSLLSGKTMVYVGKDKDNNDVGVVINTQGDASNRFMESKIKIPQMSAGEKRTYVTAGVGAAGGGININVQPDYDMNQ